MNFLLSENVTQLVAAALIAGVALALTPKGKVQNVLQLICGIYLVCIIIGPFAKGDLRLSSFDMSAYRAQADSIVNNSLDEKNRLDRTVIEDGLRAYILDKGKEMNIEIIDAGFEMKWCAEGEYWYPICIEINGKACEYDKERIGNLIETEIGVSRQNQVWSEKNG